jgi:K+-transporting ATPase ATPase A chain
MGHLVQMAGLAVQNFVSAAVGIAIVIALIRGFSRSQTDRIGNFWVDLTRGSLRVLLPLAVVFAVVLVAGGVVQNFAGPHDITTVAGVHQSIPGGPVASQEVIKELGTNGGGFYNANSAHPFENPNPVTDMVEIYLLLVIAFSLPRTFGKMVGDNRQGYTVVSVMAVIWAVSIAGLSYFESRRTQPGGDGCRRRAGGQGGPFRAAGLSAVHLVNNTDLHGRGEHGPRLPDSFRWRYRPVQHDAG